MQVRFAFLVFLILAGRIAEPENTAQEPAAKSQAALSFHFTDITDSAGIRFEHSVSPEKKYLLESMAGGVLLLDYDQDGWLDIYFTNAPSVDMALHGRKAKSALYRNNHDGTFTDVTDKAGVGYPCSAMGGAVADYNNDGWPDIVVTDLANQRYALYQNNREGSFSYASNTAGIGQMTMAHSGWGVRFFDYDNDGWKDLFVGQGHVMDNIQLTEPTLRYLEPPLLLRNHQGHFSNVSPQSGSIFTTPIAARGAAFGDLDNDGRVDVAINCNDGPAIILHNRVGNGNHWLILNLTGTSSNRDAIGSKIRLVTDGGQQQTRFVSTAGSYISASDKRVHFGLGSSKKIRLIEITWPSGIVQRLESVSVDQILQVKEPSR